MFLFSPYSAIFHALTTAMVPQTVHLKDRYPAQVSLFKKAAASSYRESRITYKLFGHLHWMV
ncbi:hypothetical protein CS542_08600 [Pedobacter sp. IW39]|nr:hypothetical protein CS542_08600 [Pedobacter sp. IW39]